MKFPLLLLSACIGTVCAATPKTEVVETRTVYLLPMGNGLDQYLANRLTNLRVLRVIANPAKADLVLTDRLGEGFENRLSILMPSAPEDPVAQAPKENPAAPAAAESPAPPAKAPKPSVAAKPLKDAKPVADANPPAETKPAADAKPATDALKSSAAAPAATTGSSVRGDIRIPISSFNRAKGTVFLVDSHDRSVVWSTYMVSKDSTPRQLDKTATRIATDLKRALKKR